MIKEEIINKILAVFVAVCTGFTLLFMTFNAGASKVYGGEWNVKEESLEEDIPPTPEEAIIESEKFLMENGYEEMFSIPYTDEDGEIMKAEDENASEDIATSEKKVKSRKKTEKPAKKALEKGIVAVAKGHNIKLTKKELNCLYRLVQSEVGYMDEKSKIYVASVVLNRVNNGAFPNTVTGVVMQNRGGVYQFSPVAPGGRYWSCDVSKETKKAVNKVLKNGDYSSGALYFVAKNYTTANKASWFDRNLKWLFKHGGQDYYS